MADDTQLIASEPLNFTKYTAWAGSAGLAAVATFTAIKTGLGDLDPRVQVGLLLLAGAFAIAVAISGAADALARAYATAHMKPDANDPKDPSKARPTSIVIAEDVLGVGGVKAMTSAMSGVAKELGDAYRDANVIGHIAKPADKDAQKPVMEGLAGALRDAAQAPRRVAVPPLRGAKYRNHSVDVLAMEFSADNATRLCIAWPDQAPMWVDANAVWFAGTGAP